MTGKRSIRTLLALVFLALPAVATSQTRPDPATVALDYAALIGRYRVGDIGPVLNALAGQDRSWLEVAVASLGNPRGWDTLDLEAAALMHSELAFGAFVPQGERDFHLGVARQLIGLQIRERSKTEFRLSPVFRRHWHLAMAWYLQSELEVGRLAQFLDLTLKRYPKDPDVLLTLGSFYELSARLRTRWKTPPTGAVAWPNASKSPEWLLQKAEAQFREALSVSDDLIEARVRLGRVLTESGRPLEAITVLTPVVEGVTDQRSKYLAMLFIGQANARAGRSEEAEKAYRQAAAVCGNCQTPWVALSLILRAQGDQAGAYGIIQRVSAAESPSDDWWVDYTSGQAWRLYPLIWNMRREVAAAE